MKLSYLHLWGLNTLSFNNHNKSIYFSNSAQWGGWNQLVSGRFFAINGRFFAINGHFLPQITSFHMTWDWYNKVFIYGKILANK